VTSSYIAPRLRDGGSTGYVYRLLTVPGLAM